jgi:hypothetical protein
MAGWFAIGKILGEHEGVHPDDVFARYIGLLRYALA